MKTRENKYEKAEDKGRSLLYSLLMDASNKSFNISEISFTNTTTRYDGSFKRDGVECVFELKYRQNSINKYSTYLLEKSKYDELERHHIDGKSAYYIMIFLEEDNTNSAIIFNISKRIDKWGLSPLGVFEPSLQPNSTVEKRGRSEKLVTFLVPEDFDIKISSINTTGVHIFTEPDNVYNYKLIK